MLHLGNNVHNLTLKRLPCHYTESFMSNVLFVTVNKLQVIVQILGVFWVNTNDIMLTTNPVEVSLVIHKFKEHTNICTTCDKREKSCRWWKRWFLWLPSLEHYRLGGGFSMRTFFHGLIYNRTTMLPPVIQ
jgi:hypothetical protein